MRPVITRQDVYIMQTDLRGNLAYRVIPVASTAEDIYPGPDGFVEVLEDVLRVSA
jgi:hypothetical protein